MLDDEQPKEPALRNDVQVNVAARERGGLQDILVQGTSTVDESLCKTKKLLLESCVCSCTRAKVVESRKVKYIECQLLSFTPYTM